MQLLLGEGDAMLAKINAEMGKPGLPAAAALKKKQADRNVWLNAGVVIGLRSVVWLFGVLHLRPVVMR